VLATTCKHPLCVQNWALSWITLLRPSGELSVHTNKGQFLEQTSQWLDSFSHARPAHIKGSVCWHTGPVSPWAYWALGRPVNGQTTAHNIGRPTVKCHLGWGFKLNYQQGKQPLTAASARVPILRIDNGDTRMKTRISFDNRLYTHTHTHTHTHSRPAYMLAVCTIM